MQKHMQTSKHKKNVERVEQMGIMKINHTARSPMFSPPAAAAVAPAAHIIPLKMPKSQIQEDNSYVASDCSTFYSMNAPPAAQPVHTSVVSAASSACMCGKVYKHMSSLCKHRKKCEAYIQRQEECGDTVNEVYTDSDDDEDENIEDNKSPYVVKVEDSSVCDVPSVKQCDASGESNSIISVDSMREQLNSSTITSILATIITEQTKRNDELKSILVQQSKQLSELSEKTTSNNVTNITTNNTVNNKFNLNLFLNTECKDAMNISEFIDSLPVNVSDLENMGSFGFVEGMTRILLNGLRQLDIDKRPIHCSDIKRESIYIKDNDTWEKDTEQNDKMKRVIRHVRHKNVKKIPEWQRNNPNFGNPRSNTHMRYMSIIGNTMGGSTEEEDEQLQNKIIRKLIPDVTIPKNHRFKLTYSTAGDA